MSAATTKVIEKGLRYTDRHHNIYNITSLSLKQQKEKNYNNVFSENIVDVISNSISILNDELANYEMDGTDYLINIKTEKIGLLDMDKIDELCDLGYAETKKQLKKININ